MANKSIKKYLASLAMRELEVKTTLRFHLTQMRMTATKKTANTHMNKSKREPVCTVSGNTI